MKEIEKESSAQTTLQCYPNFLKTGETSSICIHEKVQTIISFKPSEKNKDVYQKLTKLTEEQLNDGMIGVLYGKRKKPKLDFKLPSHSDFMLLDDSKDYSNHDFLSACLSDLIRELPLIEDDVVTETSRTSIDNTMADNTGTIQKKK